MITLRSDQEDLRVKLRVALRSHQSVLVFAPTGFGKTVVAARLIQLIAGAGKSVIFCVHRVDLITQTAKTFDRFNIPYSYIAAGYPYNPHHRVFIASIATLRSRLSKVVDAGQASMLPNYPPADYVMVDEAHLSAAKGWALVAGHYKEAGARMVGWTGSPERLDGKPLGDIWNTLVLGPSVRELIEAGHLSRYRAFCPSGVDLTGVHIRMGDYVTSEIDEIMSGRAVLAGAVTHWRKFAEGKRTIAFAPSVARSEQLAQQFCDAGVTAVALDGNTPQPDRIAAFRAYADREIQVLCNCQLFCEGFDLAAQVDRDVTIEAVLQYSPTKSLAKHLQQIGRGLRKKPEPAILLDLVGNIARLGLPDDDRQWSLQGESQQEKQVEIMTCPQCFAAHRAARACPHCGYEYPLPEKDAAGGRSLTEIEGDVEEVDVEALRRRRKQEQSRARTLDDLVDLARARGYQKPEKWAAHVWSSRQAKAEERYAR